MATKVTGNLSEEKLAAIAALFAYNGWDWDPEEERRMSDAAPVSLGPVIEGTVGKPESPDCFCRPCILDETHQQLWWPDINHAPSRKNHQNRKKLYRKFWTMLSHRGVWDDAQYIARKSIAVSRDSRRKVYVWQSNGFKRDIMPDCVIRQVRSWYPNLENQPYMGHMWQ